jgi:DNA mismatch endonuclease (patch repair protein)
MTDIWSVQKRSEVMSLIRGKGNRTTEGRMIELFRESGIKGWRRHQPLPGRPDFTFRREKVAIFVDGCFWHGCPDCYRAPKSNVEFWKRKVDGNRRRDRRVTRQLRSTGWSVVRVRECVLKRSPVAVARRVWRALRVAP